MRGMTRAMAAVLAWLALQGTDAAAQQGTAMPSYYSANNNYTSHDEKPLSTEDVAANAEKAVILHFVGVVTDTSALQLVTLVQDYFRKGHRTFLISLYSAGGSVYGAMYAYETLSRMPITIHTMGIGSVDSAATYLYCLGEKRYAAPSSTFLFHPISGSTNANMREQEANMTYVQEMIGWSKSVREACFGGVPEEWALERRDYRVTVAEAEKIGLVNAGADFYADIGEIGAVGYLNPLIYPSSYGRQ